jgi:putative transposase
MKAVDELSPYTGTKLACSSLSLPRASYYRYRWTALKPPRPKKTSSPLALTKGEREKVLSVLHDERFVDKAPQEIHAILLDEDTHICSVRTMYRYLEQENELRERRRQRQHVVYKKPELLATCPNEVWSWDITKLKGPAKWTYFHLYVVIDIFSRCVVGWTVATRELSSLAKELLNESYEKQNINREQLTIHADRGPSMRSKPVALLLSDLGVTKSHNRPYTSNDNPFSESQFKTMKYRPEFPERFGSIEDARAFCRQFFHWYNNEHRHSGISMITPMAVHLGQAEEILLERNKVLEASFNRNPARFKYKMPTSQPIPKEVWINKPDSREVLKEQNLEA